jgi:Reverse transcriptase (RNA-dependent DNA polymerase)
MAPVAAVRIFLVIVEHCQNFSASTRRICLIGNDSRQSDEQLEDSISNKGGVVSPILANLFLHYAFDAWMARTFPGAPWCRYADDGLIHCKTETQALAIKAPLS